MSWNILDLDTNKKKTLIKHFIQKFKKASNKVKLKMLKNKVINVHSIILFFAKGLSNHWNRCLTFVHHKVSLEEAPWTLGPHDQNNPGKPLRRTEGQNVSPSPSPRKGQGRAVGGVATCRALQELHLPPIHPHPPLSHSLNPSCCRLLPRDGLEFPPTAKVTVCAS